MAQQKIIGKISSTPDQFEEMEKLILEHCHNLHLIRPNAEEKKKEAILNSILIACIRAKLTTDELKECIKDVNLGKVINCDIFKNGGNVFANYVSPKWLRFAKELWKQRSVGLGTPNAASGEGELMFLFLSKAIKKPVSGDLQIGDEIFELKGEGTRVMGKISGESFRKKTLAVCQKFNLTPNKSNRRNLDAVEIEKVQHIQHWKAELRKLSLEKQKEFIAGWLYCLDEKEHSDSLNKIFEDDHFEQSALIKEIVKILFAVVVESGSFSKFIMLGTGEDVKIITGVDDFNEKIDDGTISICSDYFRINQDFKIGWYID